MMSLGHFQGWKLEESWDLPLYQALSLPWSQLGSKGQHFHAIPELAEVSRVLRPRQDWLGCSLLTGSPKSSLGFLWICGKEESGVGYYILMVTFTYVKQSIQKKSWLLSQVRVSFPSSIFFLLLSCFFLLLIFVVNFDSECLIHSIWPVSGLSNCFLLTSHSAPCELICQFHFLSQMVRTHNTTTPLWPLTHTDLCIC